MNLKDLRPATESMAKAIKNVGISALEAADRMSALAVAVSSKLPEQPELPKAHDYIRITNKYDDYYGHVAEVLWVENRDRPGIKTIHIMVNPFGGGVRKRQPIDPGCFKILNAMEVIAEAAR